MLKLKGISEHSTQTWVESELCQRIISEFRCSVSFFFKSVWVVLARLSCRDCLVASGLSRNPEFLPTPGFPAKTRGRDTLWLHPLSHQGGVLVQFLLHKSFVRCIGSICASQRHHPPIHYPSLRITNSYSHLISYVVRCFGKNNFFWDAFPKSAGGVEDKFCILVN